MPLPYWSRLGGLSDWPWPRGSQTMKQIFFGEGGDLPCPFGGVAAEAVGEDQGEAVAVAFVVDVDTVE